MEKCKSLFCYNFLCMNSFKNFVLFLLFYSVIKPFGYCLKLNCIFDLYPEILLRFFLDVHLHQLFLDLYPMKLLQKGNLMELSVFYKNP